MASWCSRIASQTEYIALIEREIHSFRSVAESSCALSDIKMVSRRRTGCGEACYNFVGVLPLPAPRFSLIV